MPLATPDQLVITKTPGMLDVPHNTSFLQRLRSSIPGVRIIMVVKNPVDRWVEHKLRADMF